MIDVYLTVFEYKDIIGYTIIHTCIQLHRKRLHIGIFQSWVLAELLNFLDDENYIFGIFW